MRRILINCIIPTLMAVFCSGRAGAQEQGSLYIQSENNQVFYAQCNGTVFVSSATGYLMFPKMPAGECTVVVSFPKNRYEDYVFKCNLAEKPLAYSLKLAVDNSWSLFDMVGFGSIKGRLATAEEKSLLKAVAAKKEGEVLVAAAPDSLSKKTDSGIQKIFDQTTEAGIDQIYVVNNDGKMDTVMVLISFLPEGNTTAAAIGKQVRPDMKQQSGEEKALPVLVGEMVPAKTAKSAIRAQSSK